jgi:hypothetical protein
LMDGLFGQSETHQGVSSFITALSLVARYIS